MKLDYLGYLVETHCTFDNAKQYWDGSVSISKPRAAPEVRFRTSGHHATDVSARDAALAHAENVILSHMAGHVKLLSQLDDRLAF